MFKSISNFSFQDWIEKVCGCKFQTENYWSGKSTEVFQSVNKITQGKKLPDIWSYLIEIVQNTLTYEIYNSLGQ